VVNDILQPTHLLFILVIALLVLGPKRLPEVGRSLGRGLRDFRVALSGEDHEPRAEIVNHTSAESVNHTSAESVNHTSAESAKTPTEPVERPG
jgi:sec-independent protein translocase protein TatA